MTTGTTALQTNFYLKIRKNVTDILSEACRLIHQCVDQELYPEGFHLFTQLAKLTITINGDYEEYCDPEMPFYDFIDAVHLDICQKDLVLDGLYLAYQAVPMPNRPEVLFAIIQDACCRDISLEALMQKGEIDLPEWDTFFNPVDRISGPPEQFPFQKTPERSRNPSGQPGTIPGIRKKIRGSPSGNVRAVSAPGLKRPGR